MPCLWQWGNTAAAVICAGLESETVQVPSNSWSHSVSNTHSWTNHPAAQGENMEKPDQDPGRTMQLTQEPFSNFPALQHLPELTDSLWSTVLCAPPCTRACQDNLQEHRVGAGRKEPTVWGGGEEEAGCGGVFVVWFFFVEELQCHLVLFLTWQAAGRMTWLPGKLLGRCTGLLPTSRLQECLPSARQRSHNKVATSLPMPGDGGQGQNQQKGKHLLPHGSD